MPTQHHRSRMSTSSSGYNASTPTENSISKTEKTPVVPIATLGSDAILPAPVVHSGGGHRYKRRKTLSETVELVLDCVLRKFGSGTAPDASSSSDIESESVGEADLGACGMTGKAHGDMDGVDEVVVDREWGDDFKASSATPSDHGEKSGSNPTAHEGPMDGTDDASARCAKFWGCHPVLVYLRWRLWPWVHRFFILHFIDEKSEERYKKENWFMRKHLALWAAAYYILNWVLSVIFVPKPIQLADKIFHYGIAPAFTFPIFFMVLYDFPRDRPWLYQTVLTISTWQYAIYQILFMFLCGYYGYDRTLHKPIFSCGSKDFLATFYYANGPQTIALFGLGLQRFPALIGTLTFMSLCFGWIVPVRTVWVRNVINFICFQAFLLYTHYMREIAERRLYTLRDQLKVQFRATQKAQVNERKAADSKRRLTSYVFHEVRVPLNTALLAVQNMAATKMARAMDIEFKALEGSLSMMSKVLNDVLDFNRMDSGRFESVARPYPFRQVMHSLFVPLKMATDARGLRFITDLDQSIDEVARRAMYEASGMPMEEICKRLVENPDEDGIVVGDETRLRQIVTNLASNACKFTPAGGKLTITTRLILPHCNFTTRTESDTVVATEASKGSNGTANSTPQSLCRELSSDGKDHAQLSCTHLARHNSLHSKPDTLERIVVRIEVSDTGKGIRPSDMAQCKLFSAFNQTELGRQQGGKGTGLGLALVRQIVKLSGGRLGVISKANQGSTFWVELPLGVGAKAVPWDASIPQFVPQTDPLRPEVGASPLEIHGDKALTTMYTPRHPLPRARSSAMTTIMDQGGLVEITTDGLNDGKVLTRTLGDRSTGTDPTPSAPLTTPESSPRPPSPRPPAPSEQPSDVTIRPQYVELPARERFVEGSFTNLSRASPAHTPSDSEHASTPGWESGMRVLVVDDDPLTRKLMARMLTRFGCRVSTAENGEIALELMLSNVHSRTPSSEETGSAGLSIEATSMSGGEEYKYSVIFLDNQMPVLSGLDTVRRLREMGRRDFVVGVTGNALLTDQREYLDAGVDHVLTKPVYEKSLKAMLTLAVAEERRKRGMPVAEPSDPHLPP